VNVFLDTSAIFAFLDADDDHHPRAKELWRRVHEEDLGSLITHNYVLVETAALIQRRLGGDALRAFLEEIVPILSVVWVDPETHGAAVSALLAAGKRRFSLVDCVSFEVMRRLGIRLYFAFDRHFAEMGFDPLG
jgi:predicted nucleic acid-binding protein